MKKANISFMLAVVGLWACVLLTASHALGAVYQEKTGDSVDSKAAPAIAEQWGIDVTSIRLTAHGHMIDFRYRVLDAEKSTAIFTRQIDPMLIHQETQKALAVPETAKIGPLRNSNTPQEGKIYWMFFGNAGHLVNKGDKVTVVIGDFRIENLVVE